MSSTVKKISTFIFYLMPYLIMIISWRAIYEDLNRFLKLVLEPTSQSKGVVIKTSVIDAIDGRFFNSSICYLDKKDIAHNLDVILSYNGRRNIEVNDTLLIRYNLETPSMATNKGYSDLLVDFLIGVFIIGWTIFASIKLIKIFISRISKI